MSNKKAIALLVKSARIARHLAATYRRLGARGPASHYTEASRVFMAEARQLKADQ